MANPPNSAPLATPIIIIGPQFCVPDPVDLVLKEKTLRLTDGNFNVTDVNENTLFQVKGTLLSLHDRCVLYDSTGNHPLVTLQKHMMSIHKKWQAYRGDSTDEKDRIFSAQKSSVVQFKTQLDVFLPENTKEDVCDYKVKGSWLERSCEVNIGDSETILAHVHKQHNVGSVVLGKDKFTVTVYPNVDYAFIVALVVLLDQIHDD